MKYSELYQTVCPPEKAKEEKFNVFGHYIGRPISVLLTLPLLKTKIKPNTITVFSIISLLCGFVLVVIPYPFYLKYIGWGLFFIWNILDGVDGNLARAKKMYSMKGDLLDTLGGYLALVLTYLAIGICAYSETPLVSIFDKFIYLILGGFAAIFSIFHRLMFHKKNSTYPDEKSEKKVGSSILNVLLKVYIGNITCPTGFLQIYFLLALIFGFSNILICLFFMFTLLEMVASLYKILR